MIEKSRRLTADMVMFDLEDSVPLQEKDQARTALVRELRQGGWPAGKTLGLRINDLESPFAYRDLIDVLEEAGSAVQVVIIPKVGSETEVAVVDTLLDQIEKRMGITGRIGLEASIETAGGMESVSAIAGASDRLESLVFGIADYGASLGMPSQGLSGHGDGEDPALGQRWLFPLSRMVMAAKARGLQAVDAPFGDFRDEEGLKRSCRLSSSMGYDGKWAIHPGQIEAINRAYTPDEEDVQRARGILRAYEASRDEGSGTLALEGRMIDRASVRLAEQTAAKWDQIRSRDSYET
jgi:citrate lyase beta subunit